MRIITASVWVYFLIKVLPSNLQLGENGKIENNPKSNLNMSTKNPSWMNLKTIKNFYHSKLSQKNSIKLKAMMTP